MNSHTFLIYEIIDNVEAFLSVNVSFWPGKKELQHQKAIKNKNGYKE